MTDKKNSVSTRGIALGILTDITEKGNFSHMVINRALNEYQELEKQERAFITRICEGTIERRITLDYIINQFSTVKINKMKPLIRNLLRMSVYQIHYMDKVPDSAVCDEAVKLAKKRGFTNLSGFVNGVLRNIARNIEKVTFPDDKKEPVKSLSVRYSMPEWIVEEWLEQYGSKLTEQMLKAAFLDRKTVIRCNQNKITTMELTRELEANQVMTEPGSYLPYALKISGYNYLEQLESFRNGYFQVQDESSMLVGASLGVKKGDTIIDVCAAPGGKSLHAAELLESTGRVDSRDVSERKAALIMENISRLGLSNIKVKVQDALVTDEESIEKADIVIADLPCSGLGVINKKPDIKYNMTREKQKELAALQRSILHIIWRYVKPGGILLYSTCTVNQEENIDNVFWLTENYPFKLEPLNEFLPEALWNETTREGYLQLIPGYHDTDGFFLARLRKQL